MIRVDHFIRYILHPRRFGSYLDSRLQVTGCHYTARFYYLSIFTWVVRVGIKPVTF